MHVWLAPSAFFPHRGGVEELTLKLGQHLVRRGHQVTVLTNRWPAELPRSDAVEGLPVLRLDFALPGRDPRSWRPYALAGREVSRTLAALERPDVVHVQCPSSQTPYMTRFAAEHGVPLVVTTQGETYMDAGGLYGRSVFARRNLRRAAGTAAALTACSRHAADGAAVIADRFSRAVVVPNGIDVTDWAGLPTVRDPVLGAWGRHVPQKGLDLLLEAFGHVRAQQPAARLVVGGSGPQTAELRARAGAGVEFVGPLDRTGVRHLLAQCRVVVVPSRIEPFGIVALEALAAGRGLVYSTRGGLAEAAGPVGRAVDPLDVGALAVALAEELASPTTCRAGQERSAGFSWDRVTAQYLDVYVAAAA